MSVPPYCAVTVAVKVTDCPLVDGFTEETTLVLVSPKFTVTAAGCDALVAWLAFPA